MVCFSYDLMQLPTSLVAAAILDLALKQGVVSSPKMESDLLMKQVAEFAGHSTISIWECAQFIGKYAKNFET
jgi:hypothetical protein